MLVFTITTASFTVARNEVTPEQQLLGQWQEVSSEYRVINITDSLNGNKTLTGPLKNELFNNLIIHQAELWQFTNGHTLSLHKNNEEKDETVKWHIKGRGHILAIQHSDNVIEDYQIAKLTDDILELYINIDLQVKGIVKLTFKKIKA